jgi:predicted ATPase
VHEDALAGRIPEGLRDVVGKRLARLRPGTNRALGVASVIGREFQVEVLQQLEVVAEDELEAALEEAVEAGIVEERSVIGSSVIYRFTHAFFRQTLYDEMIAPRRIRFHREVARVLEQLCAQRPREQATELARHFAFSSDTADLAKAVQTQSWQPAKPATSSRMERRRAASSTHSRYRNSWVPTTTHNGATY